MTNDLEPVTLDLIKRLRHERKFEEANHLLQAFRRTCDSQAAQDRRELAHVAYAKRKLRGGCLWGNCPRSTDGRSHCEEHRAKKNAYYQRQKQRQQAATQ